MNKLLFVEDEIDLGNVIKQYLELNDFSVDWEQNGRAAFERISKNEEVYDLALIDVSIPEVDGFELAEHIAGLQANIPFIFLTARKEKKDRLQGLQLGADDYIVKPFDIDELVLRIKNIIKRLKKTSLTNYAKSNNQVIHKGNMVLNKAQLTLKINAHQNVQLTLREAELLEFLFNNANTILKREEILIKLWGKNDYFLGRSMDVFVSRLRKHLKQSNYATIDNVYGVGYILRTIE